MKKLVAVALTVLAVAAFATTASATGPISDETGVLCGVIDRDGSTILTTDSRLIHWASGKVTLRCVAQGTPGANIVVTEGFVCGLGPFGTTTDSTNRVGRNGEIQLSCTGFAAPDAAPASAASSGVGAS
jgi:hypothetical protein